MKLNKKGFTLIELVVTIAIMMLVVGIALPSTFNVINKSKNNVSSSIEKQLKQHAKNYVSERNYHLDSNKTYRVLVSVMDVGDLTDVKDNKIDGRVEITGNDYKYVPSKNNTNGCEPFPVYSLNTETIELNKSSNNDNSNNNDNTPYKVIESLYDGNNEPDFNLQSPSVIQYNSSY